MNQISTKGANPMSLMWSCTKKLIPLLLLLAFTGPSVFAQVVPQSNRYNTPPGKATVQDGRYISQGARIQANMMPGTLLTDRFGVSLALQGSNNGSAGFEGNQGVDPGGRPFDWTTFAPTLNTATVDWAEGDWIGRWNNNFSSVKIDHTPADGVDRDWIPSGGEPYDVEAYYFDNDADSIYVAIVTSVPHYRMSGGSEDVGVVDPRDGVFEAAIRSGDLAISLFEGTPRNERNGTTWHYNYGIDITHENRDTRVDFHGIGVRPVMRDLLLGDQLYQTNYDTPATAAENDNPSNSDWYASAGTVSGSGTNLETTGYYEHTNFDPFSALFTGTALGSVRSVYYELTFAGGVLENDYPTYVYEFSIPRSHFGASNPSVGDDVGLMFMPGCRNDGDATNRNMEIVGDIDAADEFDFGDAPDVFDTSTASGGPSNLVSATAHLGVCVDGEVDGVPATLGNPAVGDDNATGLGTVGTCAVAGDDEDGVSSFPAISIATTSYTFDISATASVAAGLRCWIDFNRDGDFLDTGEASASEIALASGTSTNTITFSGFATPVAGVSYVRCRVQAGGSVTPIGASISAGEIEDYEITISAGSDWGDAPDSYATDSSDDGGEGVGPSHELSADLFIGSVAPDAEANGVPQTTNNDPADGDDNAGTDDEDGKPALTVIAGASGDIVIAVEATNTNASDAATLVCWADFNDDGDFADAGEISSSATVAANSGTANHNVTFSGYSTGTAAAGDVSYFRCRIAFAAGDVASFGGSAASGEVEDCEYTFGGNDWGDAPDSYATDDTDDGGEGVGPSHTLSADLFLGSVAPDAEADGVPQTTNDDPADGDDNAGVDDEDGKPALTVIAGASGDIVINVQATNNNLSDAATLACFADFNDDGDFGDTGESSTTANVPSDSGTAGYNVTFSGYSTGTAASGDVSYFRCRIAFASGEVSSFGGSAASGEVEDCEFTFGGSDWGDAPDSYATDDTDDGGEGVGPSHSLSADLFLGSVAPDAEADGVPQTTNDDPADGDDNAGTDDEDGKPALNVIAGANGDIVIAVEATNTNASDAATLVCWADFNDDGDFADAGEISSSATVAANSGTANHNVTFSGYSTGTAAAGDVSYFRCRIAFAAGDVASFGGSAASGEVEDCEYTFGGNDWGDAPDSYATDDTDDGGEGVGPSHTLSADLFLGSVAPDAEADGVPQTTNDDPADGDDNAGVDDEDGKPVVQVLPGSTADIVISVVATNNNATDEATLVCWADFNDDGDFADTGETSSPANPQADSGTASYNVTFSGYSTGTAAIGDVSYFRCRIAFEDNDVVSFGGAAASGEVEDCEFTFGGSDWSDAPDSYATDDTDDGGEGIGPNHVLSADLFLGSVAPDAEADGIPQTVADGPANGDDNNAGTNDEDGKPALSLSPGQSSDIILPVTATNTNANDAATLVCYADLNDDGDFLDTGETSSAATVAANSGTGTHNVTFSGYSTGSVTAGDISYFRCRIAFNAAELSTPGGAASSGEVEDCEYVIGGSDWGDAPDSYATDDTDDGGEGVGPSHELTADLFLGSVAPDAEINGVPQTTNDAPADGDDNAGTDDEDGKPAIDVIPGAGADITIAVEATNNNGANPASLICYADLNDDGDFGDAGEISSTATVPVGSGTSNHNVTFAGYSTGSATAGDVSYFRCRIAFNAAEIATPGGAATSGEVEDCEFTFAGSDWGDAPDSYATDSTDDGGEGAGPSHEITADLFLGSVAPDAEDDGNPAATANDLANGDDTTGTNDEDGKEAITVDLTTSGTFNMTVEATNNNANDATLACWIDFNRDGDFLDAGESATVLVSGSSGTADHTLAFNGYSITTIGMSYYRCRIAFSPAEVATPGGAATSGEIEDCEFTIGADWGDAPDGYATDGTDDGGEGVGPSHTVTSDLFLGALQSDAEDSGTPSTPDGNEDGQPPIITLQEGDTSLSVDLTATNNNPDLQAKLVCWADFNADVDFVDAGEMAMADIPAGSGTATYTLTFTPFVTAVSGTESWWRCRIAFEATEVALPTGPAASGEIEDSPFTIQSILPVELASFDAHALENRSIQLAWTTLSEENVAGYSIEMNEDFEGYREVAFVESLGDSQIEREYDFLVNSVSPGTVYFRLKMVDLDGSFAYSPVIELDVELNEAFLLEPAYPNPFNGSTTVRFTVSEAQQTSLIVYDMMGREVKVLYNEYTPEGQSVRVTFEDPTLTNGTYLMKLKGKNFSKTQSILLVR